MKRLGEGWDNVVYEVNGSLLIRISKKPDEQRVEREVALLEAVREWSTLAVPQVCFADPAAGLMAYPKIEGVFLNDLERVDPQIVGPILAEFHRGLNRAPLSDLVEVDNVPLPQHLAEAAEDYEIVKEIVPQRFQTLIERFLTATPPDGCQEPVFCHNDLGFEHILATPDGVPIAVIDWTDAAMADPAYDVGLILRDLGPAVLEAMGQPNLEERAWFHARCAVLVVRPSGVGTLSG